ncbi:MAG: hypothetical protein LBR18_05160 [Tannerella sp.]|jgi:hypothetical protein|nr:hypothetical protein [Tannerella sp.]
MNYDRIRDEAERYIAAEHGKRSIDSGRMAGGRANVEASLVVRGVEEAGAERRWMAKSAVQAGLREWAEKTGRWFTPDRIEKNIISKAETMNAGSEATVYFIGDAAIKIYDTSNAASFLDDRISAYNALFPETGYELIGLSENTDGGLQFIVKQRRIKGLSLEELIKEAGKTLKGKELSDLIGNYKRAVSQRLAEYGLKEVPYGYSNGVINITDAGFNNIMIEGEDISVRDNTQLYFVDVQPAVINVEDR